MKAEVLLAAVIAICFATPVFSQTTVAPSCKTESLEKYIQLGATGCEWGNIYYHNFTYLASATTGGGVNPANITVTPVPLPVVAGAPISELKFSANWHANAGAVEQSVISYFAVPILSVASPVAPSANLNLQLGPIVISGATGGALVEEHAGTPTIYSGPLLEVFDYCEPSGCATRQDQTVFVPTASSIFTTLTISISGGADGTSLSSFSSLDEFAVLIPG